MNYSLELFNVDMRFEQREPLREELSAQGHSEFDWDGDKFERIKGRHVRRGQCHSVLSIGSTR